MRTQVTLGDDTHGMELRWLELLERKLREERGTPAPPPPPAAATPKRDARHLATRHRSRFAAIPAGLAASQARCDGISWSDRRVLELRA